MFRELLATGISQQAGPFIPGRVPSPLVPRTGILRGTATSPLERPGTASTINTIATRASAVGGISKKVCIGDPEVQHFQHLQIFNTFFQ